MRSAGARLPKLSRSGSWLNKARPSMITGQQLRTAHDLLGWSSLKLAALTKLPISVVTRAEASEGEVEITVAQAAKIQGVLEAAGVEFLNHGQPGVRLRKSEGTA